MTRPTRRFVVLHHTGVAEPHFDVMVERAPGAGLVTWRSPVWPIPLETAVTPLVDHRRVYLTYEGPLSNDRGTVARVFSDDAAVDVRTSPGGTEVRTLEFCRPFDVRSLRLTRQASGAWTARTFAGEIE